MLHPAPISPQVPPCPAGGRRIVVADVHGCHETLRALVEERVQLRGEDQLFQLGDLIDRGPSSARTLDYLMDLQRQGYEVYPLRGNHEQTLLDVYADNDPKSLLSHATSARCRDLLDGMGYLLPQYRDFLFGLPYFYKLPDFLLVHAGFNFMAKAPFEDLDSMLWIRDWEMGREGERQADGRRVVHGHTPVFLVEAVEAVETGAPVIPLDNGCVFYDRFLAAMTGFKKGNLLALELDTLKLHVQPYCG